MTKLNIGQISFGRIVLLVLVSGVTSLQCSNSDNDKPSNIVIAGTGGSTASAAGGVENIGGESTAAGGAGNDNVGGSSEAGTGGTSQALTDAGIDAATCDPTPGANGCYPCAPKTDAEFLNHCSGSQCSPFDNAARLPLYNGGKLPTLP